jgi:DNA repair ATPase RecN
MNEIQKLQLKITEMEKQIQDLTFKLNSLSEASLRGGKREYINREVQFLQKCYNKNGVLITSINP